MKNDNLKSKKLSKIGKKEDCPVALLIKNGRILIGLRNYTPDKYKQISVWTFPGGRCEKEEIIENTLRREVLEETGIKDFLIHDFIGEVLGAKEGDNVYIFKCSTEQDPELLEPEKFSEWRWVKFSEIPANFINQKVLELIQKYV